MNKFIVSDIIIIDNKIRYKYNVIGQWKKYFNKNEELFVEYDQKIDEIGRSIAIIPLMCIILPILWLCDAEIIIEELDEDFYFNMEKIKQGYKQMYPMLSFRGEVRAEKTIKNHPLKKEKSAVFFSGGVDAFHTLIRHMEEKPMLITVWGADIKLKDQEGWKNVKKHLHTVADLYKLKNAYIKSNFRSCIDESLLSKLVRHSGDGWWHGFSHGIGIIGLSAPLVGNYGIRNLYIASSFPESMKGKYTCASDPTIDNYVNFAGCQTIHDGYECDRQQKIYEISNYIKEKNEYFNIRVCWKTDGGKNCSLCEKCYRTIMAFLAEGIDPNKIGFIWTKESQKSFYMDMRRNIVRPQFSWDSSWEPIKKRLAENEDTRDEYKWLIEMNYEDFINTPYKRLKRSIVYRAIKKVERIVRKE